MNQKPNKKLKFTAICLFLALLFAVPSLCFLHTVKFGNSYYSKQDVALYLLKFHQLPPNFVSKLQAESLLDSEGKVIGGDVFLNVEQKIDNPQNLPLLECDIYSTGKNINNRGTQRLVYFANGSAVFFTSDHYQSFVQMNGWQINKLTYIFATCSIICLLTFVLTLCCLAVKSKKEAQEHLELSFEVVFATLLFVALLPITLVLWVVESIVDKA